MSNNGQNINQEQFQNYQMNNSFQNQQPMQQQQQQPFPPYGQNPAGNYQPPVGGFVNKPQSPKIPPPSSTVTKKNYYDPPVPTATRIRSHKHGSHRNDLNMPTFNPMQPSDGQLPPQMQQPGQPNQQPIPPHMQQPGQPNQPMPPQMQQPGQPNQPMPPQMQQPGQPNQSLPPQMQQPGQPNQPIPPHMQQSGQPNQPLPPQMQQPGQPNQPLPPQMQQPGQPEQNYYYQNEQQQLSQPGQNQPDPNFYYQNEQQVQQQPPPKTPQQMAQQLQQPGQPEQNFYYQNEQQNQPPPPQTPRQMSQQLAPGQEQNYQYQNDQIQPPQQPQTPRQMNQQLIQPGQPGQPGQQGPQDPNFYYQNEQQQPQPPQQPPQQQSQTSQQMPQPNQFDPNYYYQNEQQQMQQQQQVQQPPETPHQMPQPNQLDPNLYYQNEQQQMQQQQQQQVQQPPKTPQQMAQQLPNEMPQPNQLDPNQYYQNEQQQMQQQVQQPPEISQQMAQQLPNEMPQPNQLDPNLYYQNEQQQMHQQMQQPPKTPQQMSQQLSQSVQPEQNYYYEQSQQQQPLPQTPQQMPQSLPKTPTQPSIGLPQTPTQQPMGLPQTPTQQPMGLPQTPTQQPMGLPQTPTQQPMGLPQTPTQQPLPLQTSQTPINKPPTQPTTPVSALQHPTGNRNSFDPPLPSSSSYTLRNKKSKHSFKPFRYDGEILTPTKPTYSNETENENPAVSTPTLEPPVEQENNNGSEQISAPVSAPEYNINSSYYMPGYSVEDAPKTNNNVESETQNAETQNDNNNVVSNEISNNETVNYNSYYPDYSASPVVNHASIEESGNQVTINESQNKEYEIENSYGYDGYNENQQENKEQVNSNSTVYNGYDSYGNPQETNEHVTNNTTTYNGYDGYDTYNIPQEQEQTSINTTVYSGYDSYNVSQEQEQVSYNAYDDYNAVPQEKEPVSEVPTTSFMESFGVPKVKRTYKSNESSNPTQRYIQEGIRSRDPLVYLKNGCPIVSFGFGGKIICMFPKLKHMATNDTRLMYRSINEKMATPGPIIIKSLKSVIDPSLSESEKRFKGPLLNPFTKKRGANKKEILEQINDRIVQVTSNYSSKSLNDETVLWKLIKLFIEYNGILSGSDVKEEALTELRKLLIPTNRMLKPISDIKQPIIQSNQIDELEEYLMKGDLKGAIDYCKDNNLWTHALIISNFVGKDAYKDVVISYTKSVFGNSLEEEGMARPNIQLLYSLFAKGEKEAINEVLPSSVVKSSEKWRTTLATLLGYNTSESIDAIVEFGDYLMKSGNIFAAHICYILSGKSSIFTSIDKEDVRLTLIGVDNSVYGNNALRNPLAVQLTEFYEYALSLRKKEGNSESGLGIPHFQAYKLAYAWWLSDLGYVQRATEYCKNITKIVQSYTKASPYFHKRFLESLRDLEHRCNRSWLVDEDEDVNIDEWNEKKAKFEVVNAIFTLPNVEKYEMELIPVELLKEDEDSEEEGETEEELIEEEVKKAQESPITPASDMMINQTQNMYGYTGYMVDNTMNNNNNTISNNTSYYYGDNSYMATSQPQEISQPVAEETNKDLNSAANNNNITGTTETMDNNNNNNNNNNMYGGGYNQGYMSYYSGYNATPYYPDQTQSQQNTNETTNINDDSTKETNLQNTNTNETIDQPLLNYVSDVPVIPVSTYSNGYQNSTNNNAEDESLKNNDYYNDNNNNNNYNNNDDYDDDDDLGFGNGSKLSGKKEKKEEEEEEENDEAPPSPSPSKGEHEKEKSSKMFSLFNNLFGGKDKKSEGPIKANLGEEKTIYYDPVKKRWVNPNAPEEEEKKLAPPPKANPATSPTASVPSNSTTTQSNPASTVPTLAVNNNTLLNKSGKSDIESLLKSSNSTFGISNKRSTGNIKRGARNRYVDVMASSSTPSKGIGSSFLPPPSFN